MSERLRAMIRDAARLAFTAVQTDHPGEAFYTFSLQTMSDWTGVYAHANTEDGFRTAVERYRAWKPEAVDERYYRWYWAEWAYRSIDAPGFTEIYLLLNPEVDPAWLGLPANVAPRPATDEEASGLPVYASMVAAFGDLDREGVFGRGPARDRITLFCSVEDSPADAGVTEDSAARLNTAAVYRRFMVDGPFILSRLEHSQGDPGDRQSRILDQWGFPRQAAPGTSLE